ncbi:MAG: sulfotransferase [Planctomycetota bacterium]|nr:sulfotransferase [Planctomycetota bacterium]
MSSPTPTDYRPVIILGAGRSGTNMLRDVLCSLPGFGTWPCDEINYIWRHRNKQVPVDELGADLMRPEVQRYIQRAFQSCAKRESCTSVVEKTCANTLRVEFVTAALPENAVFLHLVRDGEDVVASAGRRWRAKLDLPYLLRKARFVPLGDLPYYALRYLGTRIHRLFDREGKVSFWGPRYLGMKEDLQNHSLDEVCAKQWKRCVTRSMQGLAALPESRVLHLRYEDFVATPAQQLQRIGTFLHEDWTLEMIEQAVVHVSQGSIGKGKRESDPKFADVIARCIQPVMRELEEDGRFSK